MKQILTYVSSKGVNPLTGEVFPEGAPRMRSISEIYVLLKQGFVVSDRTDGLNIPLDIQVFVEANKEILLPKQTEKVNNKKGGNK